MQEEEKRVTQETVAATRAARRKAAERLRERRAQVKRMEAVRDGEARAAEEARVASILALKRNTGMLQAGGLGGTRECFVFVIGF